MEDNKNNKKKGFTLIELLAVIAILAVIVVIGFVAINGIDDRVDKIGKTISKESVLKAANNYANEYLIDSNYWVEETETINGITVTNDIYCITPQTLINYGFLPKEVKNNEAIKIIKDSNQKITTQIVTDTSACDNSLPLISIINNSDGDVDITNKTDVVANEKIKLKIVLSPAIGKSKISYNDFYYSIYNNSNELVANFDNINCNSSGNKPKECYVTINDESHDGAYYGTYTIKAYVTKKDAIGEAVATFTINKVNPEITINANSPQDEYIDFVINLNSKGVKYRDFNFTIYDENNNILEEYDKVDCDPTKTGTNNICSNSLNKDSDKYYGNYKIKGYVAINSNNYSEVEKNVTINNISPTITFTETGSKGTNNYFISNITVDSTTDDNSKYTRKNLCIFDNEITDPNDASWNNCNSPTNMDDSKSGKYVCAKYEVNSKPGKYKIECKQYFIDTKLPSVTISGGSYSSSNINVNATVTGDYSDGVKYAILDNSVTEANGCSNSNFTNVTSNTITSSYNTNVEKAIWLKDNAGNCKKQAPFGTGIDTSINYKYDDSSNVTHNITASSTINNIIYSNSFDDNVSYSISSNKIVATDKPVYVGTEDNYVSKTCSKSASTYTADSSRSCSSYSCNNGGKVSGSTCVGDVTFNGSTSNYKKYLLTIKYAPFTCSTKGYSYNESDVTIPFYNTWSGGCPTGYTKNFDADDTFYSTTYRKPSSYSYNSIISMSNKTMGHPSYDSCTSDANLYVYFPYTCTWTNYAATCNSYTTTYSCDSGDYRSGSTCYYCNGSQYTLSTKYCKYDCSYTETLNKYSYGRYAVLYTTN